MSTTGDGYEAYGCERMGEGIESEGGGGWGDRSLWFT